LDFETLEDGDEIYDDGYDNGYDNGVDVNDAAVNGELLKR
jgi:hypothetical protein